MLAPPFLGFGPTALSFFAELAANNEKAWFEAERARFEGEVKEPLTRLFGEAAERVGGSVKIFRQNRDIRFSKDKSPYKTNTYGMLRDLPGGRIYYASISANGFYAASGRYEIAPANLKRMRAAIDGPAGADLEAALAAVEAAGLSVGGARVATAPRGVAKDHPRIELMRMKSVTVSAGLSPKKTLDGRTPLEHALRVWEAAEPLNAWLTEHVPA